MQLFPIYRNDWETAIGSKARRKVLAEKAERATGERSEKELKHKNDILGNEKNCAKTKTVRPLSQCGLMPFPSTTVRIESTV